MSWLAPRPAQQRLTIGAAGAGSLLAVGVAGEATRGEDNSEAASASRLRRVVQLTPVFAGRQPEPALAGPEEAALLGKSEQVGRLAQRKVEPVEVLLRQLAPRVVQQLQVRGGFLLQAPLERPLAHAQLTRDLVAARLAVGQAADDRLADAVADLAVVEPFEILAGVALVQLGQHGVVRRKGLGELLQRVEEAGARGVERD